MGLLTNFTGLSTDLALANAVERTFLPTNVNGGRVRAAVWGYEPSAQVADGADIALAILPKNAKILMIHYNHEAFGTTAALDLGLAQLDGTVVDDDVFIAADDVSSAGANTIYPAANATVGADMYTTTAQVVLTATTETAVWAADKGFAGFVLYSINS